MRPKDLVLSTDLESALLAFSNTVRPLSGINDSTSQNVFVEQLVESVHRVRYVSVIKNRDVSESRADPGDLLFDPLKAAILKQRSGEIDEAFWLIFLFVHFGKNSRGGWRYAREVYGGLGETRWNWMNTSADPEGFRSWLRINRAYLERKAPSGGFGNHRKYESLDPDSPGGTGEVVKSYVTWVGPTRTHQPMVSAALAQSNGDRKAAFDILYRSMDAVVHFGRIARFDYLTMVGKLGLAAIEPGSPYILSSSGPAKGAQLLFGDPSGPAIRVADLNAWTVQLDSYLNVGMQVLEDALCNWQKSPREFKPFRG